jgi:hypothetical protein
MSQYMNKRDVNAFRREFFMDIDLTDDQLMNKLNEHPGLIADARMWTWADSVVRDDAFKVLGLTEAPAQASIDNTLKKHLRELFGDDESDYIVEAVKFWLNDRVRETKSDNWMSRGPGLNYAIRNLK